MPREGLPSTPQFNSLESLRKTFRQRLDAVLYKQLTVENIETFADEALIETVILTDDILKEYRSNQASFHVNILPSNIQEQENEAFAILDLENINEILQQITSVREKIESLKTYIHSNAERVDTVITPPQPDYPTKILEGVGGFERRIFPRLLTLMYILKHDFNIDPTPQNVPIKEGIVTSKMVRKTPYVRVEIPNLERAVYLCDEEGNVSYVFDTKKLAEKGLILAEVDVDDKGDKNSLIAYHPGIGVRLVQSVHWRDNVKKYLEEELPKIQTGIPEQHSKEERTSEFKRPQFLSFDELKAEVKALYPRKGAVWGWYKKEQKNHPDWPSQPERVYKDKGWIDLPEIVGVENRLKKVFLSFIDFQTEVMNLYKGGSIFIWYRKEQKNHKNWPYDPDKKYKNKGWIGWIELIGQERTNFLLFPIFQLEVRNLYSEKDGNVSRWYKKEQKNHPDWPSHPNETYDDWIGWSALVEKENPTHKEFLSFTDFKTEVQNLYAGQKNIVTWYIQEQKNHLDWPFNPDRKYKNKGWIDWLELVGIDNIRKKEFVPFVDFQAEVRALYDGTEYVRGWYIKEKNKTDKDGKAIHPNWYSGPYEIYKNDWEGWPELVGKKNRLNK